MGVADSKLRTLGGYRQWLWRRLATHNTEKLQVSFLKGPQMVLKKCMEKSSKNTENINVELYIKYF